MINKNNSKNNQNNFCLTSCARIYPKPSTIDMKWTLIKDLGKTCCNLQSKNKGVIKMSSFRGVASVLQGGGGEAPKCVKERVLTRLTWKPPCCVLPKRRFKKRGRGPQAPQDPPSYVPVLWQQASLPPGNFLLWLLSYAQNLPESLWPMRATHHTLVKHLIPPPLPPPSSLQRGINTSLSLLQRSNPLGSLWIMNKLEKK